MLFQSYRPRFSGKSRARQKGASAIEYAIIAGLISIAFIGVLNGTGDNDGLGDKISDVFQAVSDALPTTNEASTTTP